MRIHDCAIVGAGIHGLCTAFWLRSRSERSLVVLDRFGPGHDRGSSHGTTRITRVAYDDPHFVSMARRAHDAWPALEHAFGRPLRRPAPGVFFGPADGPMAAYQEATRPLGDLTAPLAVAAARQRFPLLRFDDDDAVLVDHSAAVVLAAETMRCLRDWLSARGVSLRWRTPVLAIDAHPQGVALTTATDVVVARAVVLACGPWSGRLHTGSLPPFVVQRQDVGYADVDAPETACEAGAFPVWARIGHAAGDFAYGLPSLAGSGLKIAWHRTTGPGVDPDVEPPPMAASALLALARSRFTPDVRGLRSVEHCLYTMTPDQRFHVVHAPDLPLVHVAACSGHAFKFGPLIGRQAADLIAGP